MAYTALYRKFRPQNFNEVVGQDHIIQTLKNQIKSGRIGHAYLFTGGRGTGKTSTAKIFAKAINCLNPKDGEPCNECEICKAMQDGSLTDVVEMDAASNNSVEDIRSIKEKVNFLPTLAKYRVYIIDEVHMLSTGAFNALLKTLEEPPDHVKFILATTEPQKLLPTILSRCQRFDFKKISNEDIIKRLKIVCKESNIQITDNALNLIATLSEGAARDALSILERCIQDGDSNIDEEKIKDLVGIPKFVHINNIITGIIEKNIEKSIDAMNAVLDEGKDLENFVWEMIKYTKDILIYKVTKKLDIYSEEEKKQIEEISNKVPKEDLIKIIYTLSELENKMKSSSQKTIIFETEVIKLCADENHDEATFTPAPKIKKEPEKKDIKTIESTTLVMQSQMPKATIRAEEDHTEEPKQVTPKVLAKGENLNDWPKAINNLKKQGKVMLYANLINTDAVMLNDMTVSIRFNSGLNAFRKELLQKPENMNALNKEVAMICGKPMQIKFEDASQSNVTTAKNAYPRKEVKQEPKTETKPENITKQQDGSEEEPDDLTDLDIPINFVEEE